MVSVIIRRFPKGTNNHRVYKMLFTKDLGVDEYGR